MAIQDETGKTPNPIARIEIPEVWANSGHCPACGFGSLKAVHFPDIPDFLLCAHCELTFEVASNVGMIRVKNIPDKLEFAEEELRYRWVTPETVRHLFKDREALIKEKARIAALAELSDEEVWSRTFSLSQLGNENWQIKQILIQAGARQEQAEAGLHKLKIWSEQNAKRQIQKLWWVGGIATLLVVIVMSGWIYTVNRINSLLEQDRKTASAQQGPLIPLQVLNALPDGVKPGFLKAPPPYVEQTGPEATRCPTNPSAAAKLFGGQEELWQPASQPDSWQMMNPGDPATIHLPAGMYAGYIDNKTFIFSTANGPATIHNVNFVAISCF